MYYSKLKVFKLAFYKLCLNIMRVLDMFLYDKSNNNVFTILLKKSNITL